MGRSGFDLGGVRVGPPAATLSVVPEWRGVPPLAARVEVVGARGVDIAPVDLIDPAAAERLAAYVWVDAIERQARLAQAIALVRAAGICPDRGDAADWVEASLAAPQLAGGVWQGASAC